MLNTSQIFYFFFPHSLGSVFSKDILAILNGNLRHRSGGEQRRLPHLLVRPLICKGATNQKKAGLKRETLKCLAFINGENYAALLRAMRIVMNCELYKLT